MVATVKRVRLRRLLDAFGVHGAGGTLGAVLTGLFARSAINPVFQDARRQKHCPPGSSEGNWHQLGNQIAGVAIAWTISIAGILILLKFTDLVVGLRVSGEAEVGGSICRNTGRKAITGTS